MPTLCICLGFSSSVLKSHERYKCINCVSFADNEIKYFSNVAHCVKYVALLFLDLFFYFGGRFAKSCTLDSITVLSVLE